MEIPDFQTIMLPLLRFMGDGKEHSIHEIVSYLAKEFNLSTQELDELLPSGKQSRFDNRVGWARTYLVKSGLLKTSRRPYVQITERGKEALKMNQARIDMGFLKQYPEFLEWRQHKQKTVFTDNIEVESNEVRTPEEIFEDAYKKFEIISYRKY